MRNNPSRMRLVVPLILVAGLSGCDGLGPVRPAPWRANMPDTTSIPAESAETQIARAYYQRVEANYLAQGQYRTDGGGTDAPFGARDLARNFLNIVFYDEFSDEGGQLVPARTQNRLHRWQQPIRLAIEFGASVPARQRLKDKADIAAYLATLSRLTGLPMHITTQGAYHIVLIQNIDERQAAAARLQEIAPEASEAAIRSIKRMKPDTYCTVFAFTTGDSAIYDRAVTVIRGELPDLLRLACIHEELAQSLGLVDDSPKARPSIFNDNQEFALLTRQDEMMLRMLYDPRLKPGMTLAEARPIIETIARELVGGDS